MATAEPQLDVAKHTKYFERCFRAQLPGHYVATEGNRMYLGFLTLNAIDLLTPRHTPDDGPRGIKIPPDERRRLRRWILSCQSPTGGFCGSPSLVFRSPDHDIYYDLELGRENFASIAATAFALQMLALLADDDEYQEANSRDRRLDGNKDPETDAPMVADAWTEALPAEEAFAGVNRKLILQWLVSLQREDGSFGEVLRGGPLAHHFDGGHKTWFVAGGYDMRYCYLVALIRWMLRGDATSESDEAWVTAIDVPKLVRYIRSCQTFDGGIGDIEAHGE